MTDEEIKEKATKTLITIDRHLQTLQRAYGAVGLIKERSVKSACHKRAITASATMIGLSELIGDLRRGKSMCMEILGAKKVPIVIKRNLKLVVNNKTGGG